MNLGVLVVGLIGLLTLTGMGCILLDNFFTKNHNPNTKHYKLDKKPIPITTNSFMEDLEVASVILDKDTKVSAHPTDLGVDNSQPTFDTF